MADLIIRAARPDDAPAILEFQLRMARETEDLELDRETVRGGVEAVFGDPRKGAYWVAERGGEIVGCLLTTFEWSDWRNGMVWWIQSVYVIPEFRRRGIYAGLYDHVKAMVEAESSIRGIRLYVDNRNTSAQDVYTRLGMEGEHYRVFEWMK